MKKETFIAVLVTFLVTTLVWFFIYLVVLPAAKGSARHAREADEEQVVIQPQSDPLAPANQSKIRREVDYSHTILGHWEPVEVSVVELDFSQYGTLKALSHKHDHPTTTDYKYKLQGDRLGYTMMVDFYEGDWHRIEIDSVAPDEVYLSLFDDPELGGRYRRN